MAALTLITPLSFPMEIKDGMPLTVVGDVVVYFTRLSREQQETHYWQRAIWMFNTAAKEPTYLRTATISLQTALLMDQLLADRPTAAEN